MGAGSHARVVGLCLTGRAPGAAPSPLLLLHIPGRAEGRKAACHEMAPFWPLHQDTQQQQMGPERRREVLPQNWGKDGG